MLQRNKTNKNCYIHEKKCKFICTFSECENRIICQKCIPEHLRVHHRQFIYDINYISELHSSDKVDKMREILTEIRDKEEDKIIKIYEPFPTILDPLIKRVKSFETDSRDMISEELKIYLVKNKKVIESTKITKSDTKSIINSPDKLAEETIEEARVINEREDILKRNSEKYAWYSDATEELCNSVLRQLNSMIQVSMKLLDNYTKIQSSHFTETEIGQQDHHETSFYARYVNSHKVASKGGMNDLEMALIESKKQVDAREQQIRRANAEIGEKVKKIEEMAGKIDVLKKELIQWQKKLEREEIEKREAKGKEKKKNEEFLIKLGVIGDNNKKINFQKKSVDDKYLSLIEQLIPEPEELDLTQHHLTKTQLQSLLKFKTVQVLKMNFLPVDVKFLKEAFENYHDLHTIQLNTCGITDQILHEISFHFPKKIKHIHLIDNEINDDGLDSMFKNMHSYSLQSLYVSYNNLTARAIDIIKNYAYDLKTLHISKNQIKSKGATIIGKYLKDIRQLFIGGTGVTKEGILAICRNSINLRRLNLVGTQLSTDIVSEILLGLQKLEWLDISYSNLTENDLQKIEKLKIFNKNLQIICNI